MSYAAPRWLKDRIAYHTLQLSVLSRRSVSDSVTCPVCAASSPRSIELCGCEGTCSVADAIEHHQRELALLNH